jgi:hypothetical protein
MANDPTEVCNFGPKHLRRKSLGLLDVLHLRSGLADVFLTGYTSSRG